MKRLLVAMLAIGMAGLSVAEDGKKEENLLDWGNPDRWTGKVLLNKEIKRSGEFSFETFGKYPTRTDFKEFIPVDAESSYTLSSYMRSLDPEQPASGYMGLYMYDENKKPIVIANVAAFPETESVLIVDVAKGALEIIVRNNANYSKHQHCAVAFNIKDEYGDLPNYDISPKVKEITPQGDDNLKITLNSPLRKSYPAGCRVRLHSPWGAPFYWAAQGWMPGEWKEFSVTLKGMADFGAPANKFWKGTKYVKPFIWFGNWNRKPEEGARLLVDDISFVKSR